MMAKTTTAAILQNVKNSLGITGTYQDDTIQTYIEEVQQYLIDGGISTTVANSEDVYGLIARGVADLWNYGSGEANLSPYFIQRAAQLALRENTTTWKEVNLCRITDHN